MYKEYKSLDGLKAHKILTQRAINNYYKNPSICKHCEKVIKIRLEDKPVETKRKKFCSRSCSASHHNSFREINLAKERVVYNCSKCGGITTKRRKYCDLCVTNLHIKEGEVTVKDVSYKNHHKSASFSYIRDRAKAKLKKERRQFCEVCKYDKHVECAHIKSISSFSGDSKVSQVNNIDNLLWLCPNHHWEFDFGGLTIEEIKESIFYHKNVKVS